MSIKKYPYYRLTVDDAYDFIVVERIFSELYPKDNFFNIDMIISFLISNPKIASLNINTVRNEGYINSIKYDEFLEKNKTYKF